MGVFASVLCGLHCIGGALLLVVVPNLGHHIMHDEIFHHVMAALVLGIAAYAFGRGYYRHRNMGIALVGGVGTLTVVGAIVATHFGLSHDTERVITVLGSAVLVLAHYKNIRAISECGHRAHAR
jgi:hypothetical protein